MKVSDNFSRHEFKCKCGNNCGHIAIDTILLNVLEDVRTHFNKPVIINSANRCIKYNRTIGSKDTSQHTKGTAADIVVKDHTPEEVYAYIDSQRINIGGLGIYDTFVHVDVREEMARWDHRTKGV